MSSESDALLAAAQVLQIQVEQCKAMIQDASLEVERAIKAAEAIQALIARAIEVAGQLPTPTSPQIH